jgi:cytochrome oxidase Cu insertion factor (SCO1/SenC/PrrC family)
MLILLLSSGGLFALVGYRFLSRLEAARSGAVASGSASTRDATYQKLPADSQADWLTGFTLTERSGKEVRWQDFERKVRVVSFFFSSCPGTCLQQNQKTREILQSYSGKDVTFLSITCDPDTDTPERLSEYAMKLEAPASQWLFLTGRLVYIRRVASEVFQVALDERTHSERLLVCDKWGNVRGGFHWNKLDEVTQLRVLVGKLLEETQPPATEASE